MHDALRDFSLAEIRMFRKRIKWEKYLISHSNTLSENKLEVASKHFTKEIYNSETVVDGQTYFDPLVINGETPYEKARSYLYSRDHPDYPASANYYRKFIEKDKASIGMLQRMFKIGFNRAARIMDQLCESGVVSGEEGTKPRKILLSMEEFEQLLEQLE